MEPTPVVSLSWWELIPLLILRPLFALLFVLSILSLGWFLAWKLVLVHVPLVQEIFGLRKKEKKEKPPTHRRYSQIYNSLDARNRASQWVSKYSFRVPPKFNSSIVQIESRYDLPLPLAKLQEWDGIKKPGSLNRQKYQLALLVKNLANGNRC